MILIDVFYFKWQAQVDPFKGIQHWNWLTSGCFWSFASDAEMFSSNTEDEVNMNNI